MENMGAFRFNNKNVVRNTASVNLKIKTFVNKTNGQISLVLPKRKLKKMIKNNGGKIPGEIKISIW
jgi:hypothetical protein